MCEDDLLYTRGWVRRVNFTGQSQTTQIDVRDWDVHAGAFVYCNSKTNKACNDPYPLSKYKSIGELLTFTLIIFCIGNFLINVKL